MASVVDTTVKFFASTQAGMPVLSGTAGSAKAVLDLLVNGGSTYTATSLTVSGGVATLGFTGTNPFLKCQVVTVDGSSIGALNGEQKLTNIGTNTISFATAAPDGTATGTITFKLAGAGWQWLFSGTNKGVLKALSPEANGQVFRIDDNDAQVVRVVGYESMTDVDTGTAPFPTVAQRNGGGYWFKSIFANATAVRWSLYADHRCFFLCIAHYTATNAGFLNHLIYGFGDAISLAPGGDPYATFVGHNWGGPSATSSTYTNYGCLSATNSQAGFAVSMCRAFGGAAGGQLTMSRPYMGDAITLGNYSGITGSLGSVTGNVDGKVITSRRFFGASQTSQIPRADMPGLLSIPQSAAYGQILDGDTLDGAGEFAGRLLRAVRTGGSNTFDASANSALWSGAALFDVTGPWR
jgi:hypothetical protein